MNAHHFLSQWEQCRQTLYTWDNVPIIRILFNNPETFTNLFVLLFSHLLLFIAREEYVATFKGSEYFCYDLSPNPIQSSSDEITLSFKTLQRNGLMLHTGKSADYVNLALKNGAVSLVINLGSGAFEALVEPVNGKFNDNAWHDVKVTRNLRQVTKLQGVERGMSSRKERRSDKDYKWNIKSDNATKITGDKSECETIDILISQ